MVTEKKDEAFEFYNGYSYKDNKILNIWSVINVMRLIGSKKSSEHYIVQWLLEFLYAKQELLPAFVKKITGSDILSRAIQVDVVSKEDMGNILF